MSSREGLARSDSRSSFVSPRNQDFIQVITVKLKSLNNGMKKLLR
jgi:hypothetical protein